MPRSREPGGDARRWIGATKHDTSHDFSSDYRAVFRRRQKAMRGKQLVLFLALLGLAVSLISPSAPSLAAGPTVTVAQGAEPATLDAFQEISRSGYNVTLHIYDPLFMRSDDGKIIPMLATGYKIVDPTTWRIALRQGVTFHNEEPFDANAVKFTFEQGRLKESAENYLLNKIKDVRVLDPYTVEIATDGPVPLLIFNLMLVGIVPPRYYQANGASYVATHPVGTGPYVFKTWVKDDRITLEANPKYWGGSAKIQTLVFRLIPNSAARVAALRNHEVDIITDFPPDLIPSVAADAAVEV